MKVLHWLCDLALMVDITERLSELKVPKELDVSPDLKLEII